MSKSSSAGLVYKYFKEALLSSRRILVIGCPGAGKTTFAKRLCGILGVPLLQLDEMNWETGWRRAQPEVFLQRMRSAMACDRAVIDGNYAGSLPERLYWADAVVYLDVPTATALLGFLGRAARRRWSSDRNLPGSIAPGEACREPLSLAFLIFILGFRFSVRPRIERMLESHEALKVVRLTSWAQCNRLLGALTREIAR
jgi:hypothetical protein